MRREFNTFEIHTQFYESQIIAQFVWLCIEIEIETLIPKSIGVYKIVYEAASVVKYLDSHKSPFLFGSSRFPIKSFNSCNGLEDVTICSHPVSVGFETKILHILILHPLHPSNKKVNGLSRGKWWSVCTVLYSVCTRDMVHVSCIILHWVHSCDLRLICFVCKQQWLMNCEEEVKTVTTALILIGCD